MDAGAAWTSDGAAGGVSPADADRAAEEGIFAQRPELFVGAAFLGGLVAAQIVRVVRR